MKHATVAIALLLATAAHAQTFGLHLASVHLPARPDQNNVNPGFYLKTEDGLTVGIYRNTLRRTSVYAGLTAEAGPFALTLGVTSGYQKKRRAVSCESINMKGNHCWWDTGSSRGALQPFLSPSVRLPQVAGITPRISFMPGFGVSSNVLHLSVEGSF